MKINSRKTRLLEHLRNEKTYQPTKFFSDLLSVSNKTIYNDIKELQEILPLYELNIKLVPRKGLKLIGTDENINKLLTQLNRQQEMKVVNYSPIYRKLQIFNYLLLDTKNITSDFLEQRFSVSNPTIQNDLKEISSFLKNQTCSLSTTNGKYQIIGNENCIQKSYTSYFLQMINNETFQSDELFKQFIQTFFEPQIVNIVFEVLEDLINLSSILIGEYYKTSLIITLLIQVSRIRMNHHSQSMDNLVFEDLNHYESYLLAVDISKEIEKKSSIHFLEEDIKSLSQRLFAHRIEPTIQNDLLKKEYQTTVSSLIEKMSKLINIDLMNDTHLRNSLLYHIPSMVFRLKNNYLVKNPLLNQIKEQYLLLYSMSWFVLSDLEDKYDLRLSDDEVSFILIHFQIALDKIIYPKKIVIVCEHGIATSELILSKVQQIIPSKQDIIKILTKSELLSSDLRNVDMIISTINLPENLEFEYIKVNPFLRKEDINNILKHYSELTFENNNFKKSEVLPKFEFEQYFSEDFIFIDQEFKDKDECLKFITNHYQNSNLVNQNFEKSLLEREKIGNTALSTKVAIPHASPSSVLETKLMIINLKTPIRWHENNSIDFVVVLGISENNLSKIRNLVAIILEIVDDPKAVSSLKQAQSKSELLNLWRCFILKEDINND